MHHGQGSGVLQAGEQNITEEKTQEKVWAQRRSKVPLLGRVKGGGVDHHGNLFPYACMGSQRAGGRLW